jgi:molybdate transport system permease protein
MSLKKIVTRSAGTFRLAGTILLAAVCFYLAAPVVALFFRFDPSLFISSLCDPFVYDALFLSMVTSFFTVMVVTVFGTPAAYIHCRRQYIGKSLVEVLIDLPLILPPAVAGIALLVLWGRTGLIGKYLHILGINIAFTTLAVVMAQIFVASPLYLRQAKELFSQIDPAYEQTARTLGASQFRIFIRISLPLVATGLLSATIMTFARALGEFGATIMFAGNLPGVTQTMPLAIYSAMQGNFESAITISLLLVLISFSIMALIRIVSSRREAHA